LSCGQAWTTLARCPHAHSPHSSKKAYTLKGAIGRGFLYLIAVMDWASRAVLAWRLSNTMDVSFCVSALEEALARFGKPEIFNTDQGSQCVEPTPPPIPGTASSRGASCAGARRG
jgi:putative transposase